MTLAALPALIECLLRSALFFCRRLRSHIRMDPDLENVIRQALGVAKAAGRDDMGQTMIAVQAGAGKGASLPRG